MSNQSLANPGTTIPNPNLLHAFPEVDDDDDHDAEWDDDDDGDTAAPTQARWFSRAGFGSPEWWIC